MACLLLTCGGVGRLHGFSIATISMLEENAMKVLDQGVNPLFTDPDPDKAREFFRQKPRAMVDKRMTEKEVVEKFIPDGCYLGIGGFGANRIPTAAPHSGEGHPGCGSRRQFPRPARVRR